nr:reverse transcriptase domain-containing protein [Tanacetum cinerariifolium]
MGELMPKIARKDQDSLNAAVGGNLLEKSPQDALTIIENKLKVRNSQSKPIASPVNSCDTHSSYELAKLTHAVNQQTSVVTTVMTAMLKQLYSNPPPAQVKAVEEIRVTCGGAYPYYQYLVAGGNTFPEYRDNIQGYVSATTGNYNKGNPDRHGENKLRNEMKTSIQTSLSNQTNEIKNMMASLLQMKTASTSGSGTLPGNTIANPKGELKAITTRSGLVTEGPTVPNPPKSINPEEDESVEETYTDPNHTEYTIKVPPPPPVQKPKPPIQRNFVLHTRDSLPSHITEDFIEDLVSNKQSGNPTFSLHKEIASPEVIPEIHDSKGCNFLSEELPDINSFNDIHPYFYDDPLSGSTTFSANSLL